jgi:hypothetical protein
LKFMKLKSAFAGALASASGMALAHDGHGMFGAHWHATDTVGLLLVGGIAALVFWFWRGGK